MKATINDKDPINLYFQNPKPNLNSNSTSIQLYDENKLHFSELSKKIIADHFLNFINLVNSMISSNSNLDLSNTVNNEMNRMKKVNFEQFFISKLRESSYFNNIESEENRNEIKDEINELIKSYSLLKQKNCFDNMLKFSLFELLSNYEKYLNPQNSSSTYFLNSLKKIILKNGYMNEFSEIYDYEKNKLEDNDVFKNMIKNSRKSLV